MSAGDDFAAPDECGAVDRSFVTEIGVERIVGIAIGIEPHQSIESLVVVRSEPAGEQNLAVRLDQDVAAPTVEAGADVERGVATSIRIQAGDAHAGGAIIITKVAGDDNPAVGLNRI